MSNDRHAFPLVHLQFHRAKALCNRSIPLGKYDALKTKSSAQVALSVKQQAVKRKSGELKLGKSKHSFIGIRFEKNERETVVKHAEQSGLTISEYVRASVLGAGYISTIDPVKRELLQNISRELGRQGNNLNQIAKHLNGNKASPEQGDSLLAHIARSLLAAHKSVRLALAEGRSED